MVKIILKNMCIYRLYRNIELDHEKGRPAILLFYKTKTSLIWWGTTKLEKFSKEIPLIVELNQVNGYFYSKGIEKVKTEDLKRGWIDFKTHKPYFLSNEVQKQLITKFAECTNQKDPYQRIALLELENQYLKKEIELLNQEKELKEIEFELEIE